MNTKLNILPTFFRNLLYDGETNYIKFLIIAVLIAAVLAFFHGAVKENIINTTSVVTIILTLCSSYFYFKKQYNYKIKSLQNKLKSMSQRGAVDSLCNKKKNSSNDNVCLKYYNAKKNYYTISNLILQQYNFGNE